MQAFHRSRHSRDPVIVVQRAGPRTVDGIIAAAAAVTVADGIEQADERRGLLRFLRDNGLLGVHGRRKTLARYQDELDAMMPGSADIPVRLHHLAGTQGASLVAAGAFSVAVADGVVGAEERAVLRRLYASLGLSPVPALA